MELYLGDAWGFPAASHGAPVLQSSPAFTLPARGAAAYHALRPAATAAPAIANTRQATGDSTPLWSTVAAFACGLTAGGAVQRKRAVPARRQRTEVKATSSAGAAKKEAGVLEEGASLKLFSPAKINLFLRIMGKRPDGYHDLASLFHAVSFGDTVSLRILPESADRDEVECNLPGVPLDESNLVVRALNLFRKNSGVRRFFNINLEKNTPAQAGMGGGSSNAATTLFGANELCGRPASTDDLMRWTEDPDIGSDATFFLCEGAAFCTGRGEIVQPVAPLPIPAGKSVYLVKPRYGLSTPKVFKALDLSKTSSMDPKEILSIFETSGTDHNLWVNDLEHAAFEVNPDLGKLKAFLSRDEWGFEAVLMSGSGTTIFCLGDPKGGAAQLEAVARDQFDIEGIWRAELIRRTGGEWFN